MAKTYWISLESDVYGALDFKGSSFTWDDDSIIITVNGVTYPYALSKIDSLRILHEDKENEC